MSAMTAALKNKDIVDLAAYFSSLSQTAVTPAMSRSLTCSLDKASANEFPQAAFISMKKSASIQRFPEQAIWKGGA